MSDSALVRRASEAESVGPKEAVAIELEDVVKRYPGGGVLALDHLDLVIAKNEFVAVSGPSGCGKSTLLHLIAALDRPTSGRVLVNGRDLARVRDLSFYRRNEVGLVFQLHELLPRIPVLANIEIVMYGTHRSRRARHERARELLGEVDLEGRGDRLPTQLSGGERQRVAIARALANEPGILLADEPTGNLDKESAKRVMELFGRVRESGVTVLLVTHDEELAAMADRTDRIEAGRLVRSTSRP
jgi:putative ABC transport system ATP-binding protein